MHFIVRSNSRTRFYCLAKFEHGCFRSSHLNKFFSYQKSIQDSLFMSYIGRGLSLFYNSRCGLGLRLIFILICYWWIKTCLLIRTDIPAFFCFEQFNFLKEYIPRRHTKTLKVIILINFTTEMCCLDWISGNGWLWYIKQFDSSTIYPGRYLEVKSHTKVKFFGARLRRYF